MRGIAMTTILTLLATGALAQGQMPGTLPPAPPVIVPPPPVAPAPVPSAVTPLPQPSYGIPPGVTRAPSYGSDVISSTIRSGHAPKKPKKRPRRFRGVSNP